MKKFDLFELKEKIEKEKGPKKETKETVGEVLLKIAVSLFIFILLSSLILSYDFRETIEYPMIGILGILLILRIINIIKNYKKRDK